MKSVNFRTLTRQFPVLLSTLTLACQSENVLPADKGSSKIAERILHYYKDEPVNAGFVSDIQWYLKDPAIVDFATPKVVHVMGVVNKKESTVLLVVYWVGAANETKLEITGPAGGRRVAMKPQFVDKSGGDSLAIREYVGSAHYEISADEWTAVVSGGPVRFRIGEAKFDDAISFAFLQDVKGNIRSLNLDAKATEGLKSNATGSK